MDGRGVDVVLESVGGEAGARTFECLAPLGRFVMFRAASGEISCYLQRGWLETMIGLTLPLAEAAEAHRELENRETTGKVLLTR